MDESDSKVSGKKVVAGRMDYKIFSKTPEKRLTFDDFLEGWNGE